MALTKKVEDDQIEIIGEYKILQIRQSTIIAEDGVEISRNFHRRVVHPGDDGSNETDEIKAHNSSKNIQKLAQFFPEGVTEKVYEQKDSNGDVVEVTIIRIVVRGNKADEYKKVRSKWGVGYFKNGGVISQNTWDTESN